MHISQKQIINQFENDISCENKEEVPFGLIFSVVASTCC